MLSYRHSFHAGNFADVLKHAVEVLILEALKQKESPFIYHDTHSAAGRYSLSSAHSEKTAEYVDGIARIWQQGEVPAPLIPYLNVIKQLNSTSTLKHYPGSPLVARLLLREQDRMQMTELHPADVKLLEQEFAGDRQARVYKQDAYEGLKALLPGRNKRGLVLLDPSYEIKTEYRQVVQEIAQTYRRFATGTYALWYPVIERRTIDRLMRDFVGTGIKKILVIELCVTGDSAERGMTGTGMVVINPPWKLYSQMEELLPWLTKELGQENHANFRLEWLVPE